MALHATLELAPELGAGHESRQIQEVDLLGTQLEGHVPGGDALGQALGDGGFAHAGLADEAGVVLLAAVQNLHHPLNLFGPADDGVQLALAGPLAQIDAVAVQKLVLFLGFGGGALGARAVALALLGGRGAAIVEKAIQKREGGGLAGFLVVGIVAIGQVVCLLGAAEGLKHLVADVIQILGGDAHALDHLLDLGQVQLGGALQAQALVDHLVFLIHAGDEHHGHIFSAFGTKGRLHIGFLRIVGIGVIAGR